MSKYQINGGVYEVDDSLQGDDLNTTLQQLADVTAHQNQQKFLGLIGKAEGGHDPWLYLRDVLSLIPTHPARDIDALLPHHHWTPSQRG